MTNQSAAELARQAQEIAEDVTAYLADGRAAGDCAGSLATAVAVLATATARLADEVSALKRVATTRARDAEPVVFVE